MTICAWWLEGAPRFWHGRAMGKRNSKAGGLFLTIGSLGGFGWGIGAGEPLAGALLGTALGSAAALLLWLLDRRS